MGKAYITGKKKIINMKIQNIVTYIFILLFLSACGFKPVFSNDNLNTKTLLGSIEVEPINSIEGTEFYNHLKLLLPSVQKPTYILTATLSYNKEHSIIQKNSDISREMKILKVAYYLAEKSSGKIVYSGNFTKFSSFSTTYFPYTNTIQEQAISENLALAAATEVRNRLILYFKNRN
jgi:hypothetical protein